MQSVYAQGRVLAVGPLSSSVTPKALTAVTWRVTIKKRKGNSVVFELRLLEQARVDGGDPGAEGDVHGAHFSAVVPDGPADFAFLGFLADEA